MKIVVAHNAYRQRGGEDIAVDAEVALLRRRGHEVVAYRRGSDELETTGVARAAVEAVWSARTAREFAALLAQQRPQLVHLHNPWPRLSPSLLAAAAAAGVPVVHTVHNMRLACPQGALLRDGRICEDCVGHVPWRAVVHGCYRGSRAQSLVLATALQVHRVRGSWQAGVARFIALSHWSRGRLVAAGLPQERIDVLPNFAVAPPGDPPRHDAPNGEAARPPARAGLLFVGRLSAEKGVAVLAQALRAAPELTIDVIGEGPQAHLLDGLPNARLLGALPREAVQRAMLDAAALVAPSIGHENSPLVLIEAMAAALPAIASAHGALAEHVQHGETGWLVRAGDAAALVQAMREAVADPSEACRRGAAALRRHAERHAPAVHAAGLEEVYARVLAAGRG